MPRPTGVPDAQSAAPLRLDPEHFAVNPWRLIEHRIDPATRGQRETLFAVGNGYLGVRGSSSDGTLVHDAGTYINGFHETWPLQYPEDAVGFARVGQTMLSVPDATRIDVIIDGERFVQGESSVYGYERTMDFQTGQLRTEGVWTTQSGQRFRCSSTRMVSLVDRHLAVFTMQVESLDGEATVILRSELGPPYRRSVEPTLGDEHDPRQATKVSDESMTCTSMQSINGDQVTTYQTSRSELTVGCAVRHAIDHEARRTERIDETSAVTEFQIELSTGPVTVTKLVAYHDTVEQGPGSIPEPSDPATRCIATLDTADRDRARKAQREYLDKFWSRADIEIDGSDHDQQALRWNLFTLLQASACSHGRGVSAKGVTSAGYDGHYFWDTEIYIVPFLTATLPDTARSLLKFRYHLLDAARERAGELSETGALYPWRTITGAAASAYFLAGTAQYHINSAVGHAVERYVRATGDDNFVEEFGAEIIVEIARFWLSLGFYDRAGDGEFHLHGVTGPDEYTALVNDNFYTNVMAQADLRHAAAVVEQLRTSNPDTLNSLALRLELGDDEADRWTAAADAMHLPYDDEHGIYLQCSDFLQRKPWPWDEIPRERYPLLLNFHPLVIYRHKMLKQPDVVMAMYLRSQDFSLEEIRRNFDFYEPLTTGDSSLSSCVQSIVAALTGQTNCASMYLNESLYLDLCDTHANTADGAHVASTGGVWAALIHGILGIEVHADRLTLRPSPLPNGWTRMKTQLLHRGDLVHFEISPDGLTISTEAAELVLPILIDDTQHELRSTSPITA